MIKENCHFKYVYDKIYTIGFYPDFYISLKDKHWANGGHFEFYVKELGERLIFVVYVYNPSLNHDMQMINAFYILKESLKSWVMPN